MPERYGELNAELIPIYQEVIGLKEKITSAKDAEFIGGLAGKIDRYKMSVGQEKWLRDVHARLTGTADEKGNAPRKTQSDDGRVCIDRREGGAVIVVDGEEAGPLMTQRDCSTILTWLEQALPIIKPVGTDTSGVDPF